MTRLPLPQLSVEELVERFVELAKSREDLRRTYPRPDYSKQSKKLYDRLTAVDAELKRRQPDGRLALLPLLSHPNLEVRCEAAVTVIAVAPTQALATLEALSQMVGELMAFRAHEVINLYRSGEYRPT
jgi:hypothetical protein